MKPYKTEPLLVERIWGGRRLSEYNKCLVRDNIGESWETGGSLSETPILVKLIDAKEALSVQVHPDDEFANRYANAGCGKNEAWVILECDADSYVVYGFSRQIDKVELSGMIKDGQLEKILRFVKVRKGDCIYVPAGTVHCLGKGILAYEVQQPSDLTYRLYDWDRTDGKGLRRELQQDKAVAAINYNVELPPVSNIYDSLKDGLFNIIECEHFQSSFACLESSSCRSYETGKHMVLTLISGSVELINKDCRITAKKGDTCIIPGGCDGNIVILGLEKAEYIITTPTHYIGSV